MAQHTRLTVLAVAACLVVLTHVAAATGVLMADSIRPDITLSVKSKSRKVGHHEAVGPLPTGLAWDGLNYWTSAGGDNETANLLHWCAKGNCIDEYDVPHLDIRSIWVAPATGRAGTTLYADVFNDEHVYEHKGHGRFEDTGVSLHGPHKDDDSPVLYRPASLPGDPEPGVLVASDGVGDLLEYNAGNGEFLREVVLVGLGSEPGESDFPNYVRFAIAPVDDTHFYYLTYAAGRLHLWSPDGKRVGGATLAGASDNEMACHSISFAKEHVWVQDPASGTWRGFKLDFSGLEAPAAQPEPGAHGAAAALQAAPGVEVCPMAVE